MVTDKLNWYVLLDHIQAGWESLDIINNVYYWDYPSIIDFYSIYLQEVVHADQLKKFYKTIN
jgi:hypothetical protein